MNRRTGIKGILALGIVGASSFSIFKYLNLKKTPDIKQLIARKSLIAELAETIIPRTDTPGAKDAKVEDYIIKIITDCTDVKNQNIFINGLADVEDYSRDKFDKSFQKCSIGEKTQVLQHFEKKSHSFNGLVGKVEGKFLGEPFFTQLKKLTVTGYCTSEPGATQGLAYDYIPHNYDACIPLKPHQKSWATQ
jgi:hypothetical protein